MCLLASRASYVLRKEHDNKEEYKEGYGRAEGRGQRGTVPAQHVHLHLAFDRTHQILPHFEIQKSPQSPKKGRELTRGATLIAARKGDHSRRYNVRYPSGPKSSGRPLGGEFGICRRRVTPPPAL